MDPVLVRWVPDYVLEQYKRYNPYFVASLRVVLGSEKYAKLSNRAVLRLVKKKMEQAYDIKRAAPVDSEEIDQESQDGDAGDDGSGDEHRELEEQTRAVLVSEPLPSLAGDDDQQGVTGVGSDWQQMSLPES